MIWQEFTGAGIYGIVALASLTGRLAEVSGTLSVDEGRKSATHSSISMQTT